MSYNWFECKIKYDKMLETGIQRSVTESYLVDALSFTEAEARIIEEIKPFISGEFSVSNVRRMKFAETFFCEGWGDRYYRIKLYFLTLDEKSGSEKKMAANMLVHASSLKEAVEIVEAEMKKTVIDYDIVSVIETAIMDVFPYPEKIEDSRNNNEAI